MNQIQGLAPMLGVPDVTNTAHYYRDRLGFEIVLISDDPSLPDYAIVSRDDFQIHLIEEDRDVDKVRSGMHVMVRDVDALFNEFRERGAFAADFPRHLDAIREHPPEDKDYGLRDMIFVDPSGHILLFGQPL